MNILLLGGNSVRHQSWLDRVQAEIADDYDEITKHQYQHWATGQAEIDLDHELSQLDSYAKSDKPYQIFAKSAGTILSLMSINAAQLRPVSCVFTGIPLVMVEKYDVPIQSWLKSVSCPVKILQQMHDPYGSHKAVAALVATVGNPLIHVIQLPGQTHDYEDFQTIRHYLTELI